MDLVFDIGANNGDDTAYYLYKGFRVVAVEANPVLAERLKARFSGKPVTVLNVGVAGSHSEMTFWVCEHTDWSTFDLEWVKSKGVTARPMRITTVPLSSIVDEFGMPLYCKIDIEGLDRVAVGAFSPDRKPAFLSIEMSYRQGDQDIEVLTAAGYSRFKIVSQVTRKQPWPAVFALCAPMPERIRSKLQRIEKAVFGKATDGTHAFPIGSSGPFGDDIPGPWLSKTRTLDVWLSLSRTGRRFGEVHEWFDIHATH
jgi:FkbM family methyltransferase